MAPGAFRASTTVVEAAVGCDAVELKEALVEGKLEKARALYLGRFLLGVSIRATSVELNEWMEDTADSLARDLQSNLLARASRSIRIGRRAEGASLVRAALKVADASLLEVDDLSLAHDILTATRDPAARTVFKDVMSLGLPHAADGADATSRLYARLPGDSLELDADCDERGDHSPPTPRALFGRDEEKRLLYRMLVDERRRCVTVTGPGGVGKSALATAVGAECVRAGAFPGGHALVRCHGLERVDVESAVLQALGVTVARGLPELDQVRGELISRPSQLLILDDFDHLAASSGWLSRLFAVAPGLSVMVTSVRPLGLPEERVLPVEGLSSSGTRGGATAELFLDRARRVDATYALTADDMRHVPELRRLTGGLPLAIEMAASLVTVMSLAEIVSEVARGIDILTTTSPDGTRHGSLLAVFERCWSLCDERERQQMAKLAVFRGAFDRRAAESVAGVGPHELARLLARSLLGRPHAGMFEVHAAFRSWIRGRWEADTDAQAEVWRRHADFFARQARAASGELDTAEGGKWLARLDEMRADMLASIDWTLERGDAERTLDLLDALAQYWVRRGCVHLIMPSYDQLATAVVSDSLAARMATCLGAHAFARMSVGRLQGVSVLLGRALELAEAGEDPRSLTRVLNTYGIFAIYRLQFIAAEEWYQKALALAAEHGLSDYVGRALNNLGDVQLYSGHPDLAHTYYVEALEIERGIGNLQMVSNVLGSLGLVAAHQGRLADAERALRESLELVADLGITFSLSTALEQYASLFVSARRPRLAGRMWGSAEAIRRRLGTPLESFAALDRDRWLAKATDQIGREALEAAIAEGQLLDSDTAMREALVEGARLIGSPAVHQTELGRTSVAKTELGVAQA